MIKTLAISKTFQRRERERTSSKTMGRRHPAAVRPTSSDSGEEGNEKTEPSFDT